MSNTLTINYFYARIYVILILFSPHHWTMQVASCSLIHILHTMRCRATLVFLRNVTMCRRVLYLGVEGNRTTFPLHYTDCTTHPFIPPPLLRSRPSSIHTWDGLGLINCFSIAWKLPTLCQRTTLKTSNICRVKITP